MTTTPHDPDQLAQRLDAALPADSDAATPDDDPLVTMALTVATAPHPTLSPDAAARIRAKTLRAYDSAREARRVHIPLGWAAAVAAIMTGVLLGLTPAALASLPDEALYPMKGIIEQVEFAAARSPEAQAFTYLLHARRRADEAQGLARRGQSASEVARAAYDALAAAAGIARQEGMLSAAALSQLNAETMAITAVLDGIADTPQPDASATATTSVPTATHTPSPTVPSPSLTPAPTAESNLSPPPASAPIPTDDDASIDCSNPPPDWAPAEGWRERCESGAAPQDNGSAAPSGGGPPAGVGPPEGAGPPAGAGRP
jgi:hypothetical protein